MRMISAVTSSAEATAGRTSRWVSSATSSTASTLAGSDMASSSGVLVEVGDGHRAVALGRGGAQQVGGRHVDLEDAEVEVIEAVALGDRARELLGGDGLLVEQHALRRDAGRARVLDRTGDGLLLGEAELDHHVGQLPARAAAPASAA